MASARESDIGASGSAASTGALAEAGAFVPGVFQSTWAVPIGVPGATPGAVHTSYSALAWCPAPSSPASADRSAKEWSSMARFS